jgi:Raf kinase inhibitor-like YbhB/YbcL family protein
MKKRIWCAGVLLMIMAMSISAQAKEFVLKSPGMEEGSRLKNKHVLNGVGCRGGNVSPALIWENAPVGTKSYAVSLYDPDAPTGSGWWHWVMFNIPSEVTALEEAAGKPGNNLAPEGSVQSRTDFGATGYGGACPPEGSGSHRYIFTINALDIEKLELSEDSTAAMVGFVVGQHSLGTAQLMLRYSR